MSVKIGILAEPSGFIQSVLEQIGLDTHYQFTQEFESFNAVIIPDYAALNADKKTALEDYVEQGGRALLFTASNGNLPWGIRAVKIAEHSDAIIIRAAADDIAGDTAGMRLPLWGVPAMALQKSAKTQKTAQAASFQPQLAPAILSLESSKNRALICGFPLFESLRRCASSTWPYGYGALVSMLKAMVNCICRDFGEPQFKFEQPIALISFDMEAPIVNRAMGKTLVKLPVPGSHGKSVFITSHKLQQLLPLKKRILTSRTQPYYGGIQINLYRLYIDWHLNRRRLFNPRIIRMLQFEQSAGKHLVPAAIPQFKKDLLDICGIFNQYGLRCTFFIPGEIPEAVPDASPFADLQSNGFEFALHSYRHDHYGNMNKHEITNDIRRSIEAFRKEGIAPSGSRCPGGFMHKELLPELQRAGIIYDSSISEPYDKYPILPVKNPLCNSPFYQVPMTYNFYRENPKLMETIDRAADRGGLLHLYGHDHEFHRLDADGAKLKGLLDTLQQRKFKIMTIRDFLGIKSPPTG